MKKSLLFLSLVAAMFTTSCSQEDMVTPATDGSVTFELNVEGNTNSRAVGQAEQVDKLVYQVFDANGNVISSLNGQLDKTSFPANVKIDLVKGQSYTVAFWAQDNDCAAYNTADLKNVTVDYAAATNNAESSDAFYAAVSVVGGATSAPKAVVLNRATAQINVGITEADYNTAAEIGVVIESSNVTISNVAQSLNLLTGKVGNFGEVTLAAANVPSETLAVAGVAYKYLSLSYVLVADDSENGANKALADVNYTFTPAAGAVATQPIDFECASIPVQRNYRTNIVGRLLTGTTEFEVSLDPIFKGDLPCDVKIGDDTYTFAEAIEYVNASSENLVIDLERDVVWATGAVGGASNVMFTAEANASKTVTINGNGHTMTFTGMGGVRNEVTVNINNAVIVDETAYTSENGETVWEFCYLEFEGGDYNFDSCLFNNSVMFDASNVVVKDSEFKGISTNEANQANEYSAWANSGAVEFINCSFGNGYRGLKVGDMYDGDLTSIVVDGCSFKNLAKKPGVAINNTIGELAVTIKNSIFENVQPGDQGKYFYETDNVVPTLERNTLDGLLYVDENTLEIADATGLFALANEVNGKNNTFEGKTVNLTADVDLANVAWDAIGNVNSYPSKTFAGIFNGQDHTISNLNVKETGDEGMAAAGIFGSITGKVQNLKVDKATVVSSHYAGVICGFSSANVGMEISNCHVTNSTVTSATELIGGSYDNGDKAGAIIGYMVAGDVVKGCSVANTAIKGYRDLGAIVGYGSGTVENCQVFDGVTVTVDAANNYKGYTKPAEFDANTFVGENHGTITGCTGEAKLKVPGGIYTNGNCYNTIADALVEAVDGGVITLEAGNFAMPSKIALKGGAKGTITIVGAGDATVLSGEANSSGMNVVMKNLKWTSPTTGYDTAFTHANSVSFENCSLVGQYYAQSAAPHTFTECTFDPQTGYVYTYGANCTFEGCTFNSSKGKALQVYAEMNDIESTITINNCKFTAAQTAATGDGKPVTAIDINSIRGNKFNVNITNSTATGYATGLYSGSSMWNIKGGEENVSVTINGVKVK